MERVIYDSSKEAIVNMLFQLNRLKEEGHKVGSLEDQSFRNLEDLIDAQRADRLKIIRRFIGGQIEGK